MLLYRIEIFLGRVIVHVARYLLMLLYRIEIELT